MDGNGNTSGNMSGSAQLIAQWITSLAISVICCAVLFVVFAGYIVDLHSSINLATVRLEVVQEKHNHLMSEVGMLRRSLSQQQTFALEQAAPEQGGAQAQTDAPPVEPPPPAGVQISEPAPIEPDESGDMTPVMLPNMSFPGKDAGSGPSSSQPKK